MDGSLKFIYELRSGRSKLFDIDQDPQETIDRRDDYAAQARWYEQNLTNWSASQKQRLVMCRGERRAKTAFEHVPVGGGLRHGVASA